MMRSLWSGVSGLQSHQIAMDVEGDNIANVNTVGFKYSRANFADIFSQTSKPATAPEGELGGKNAMQVGLGTQIVSTQQVFSQGSLQTTDVWSDLAIQGSGFFMVTPDGGLTKYYTRNGEFTRDVLGNFVDSNGYIVQGWMRDEDTGTIDPTVPVTNIRIEPGLSMPANPTSEVIFKGNLNSGEHVGTQSSAIYSLDSHHGWLDKNGNSIVTDNELFNRNGKLETSTENDTSHNELFLDSKDQIRLRERGVDMGVVYNENGDALNLREGQGVWISYTDAKLNFVGKGGTTGIVVPENSQLDININGIDIRNSVSSLNEVIAEINKFQRQTGVAASIVNGNQIMLTNQNNTGETVMQKNIKIYANATNAIDFDGNGADKMSAAVITAYQYTYSSIGGVTTHDYDDASNRIFKTTEDLREAMQQDLRQWVNYDGDALAYEEDAAGIRTAKTMWYENNNFTAGAAKNKNDGVIVTVNQQGQFQIENPSGDAYNEDDYGTYDAGAGTTDPAGAGDEIDGVTAGKTPANTNTGPDDKNVTIAVTALSSDLVNANSRMADSFSNLAGNLSIGSTTAKTTGALKMSTHSMTTEIYDSLGSKHEITVEYRKVSYSPENGTEWSLMITVPEPGILDDQAATGFKNVLTGNIRFGTDGALVGYSPSVITFTANNGSAAGQAIEMNFGDLGGFNGITSYDAKSSTEDIKQDGYTGGTLNGLRVDQSGKIIGSFTNGHSLALAQVAMASFTNNNGLEKLGGNVWGETANSGGPVIGAAATGSRGKINASTVEMSNVDLSRAFTQLIVVQRGYQANSKTITTSDNMLNTLLQLKQ